MASTELDRVERQAPDRHIVPVFVVEFDDERSRSRLREAAFVSIIVHLVLFIMLLLSPKWMARLRPVLLASPTELIQGKELTYLDLPKDNQQTTRRPNTNVISDKDRVAMSRHPNIDRKTLEELRDNRRAGRPGLSGPPAPPAPPMQAQSAATQAQPQQNPPANQLAHLDAPPIGSPRPTTPRFSTGPSSAGSAIDQAARAAAAARRSGGGSGDAGDYGLGHAQGGANLGGDVDILSDTMGFDFSPYLSRIRRIIQEHWWNGIPESAYPPLRKHGKVAIDFAILKDGTVAGMKLYGPSGDVALDRAAWGGITGSNPFPPLPNAFPGEYLAIRCRFYYNPERGELSTR